MTDQTPTVYASVDQVRVVRTGDRVPVIDEVTLNVIRGRILGLVGESGSGKSTAALTLFAYARTGLTIDAGTVRLDGSDLLSVAAAGLQEIRGKLVTYVPQDPTAALNPGLRIGKQLREVLAAHGVTKADAAATAAHYLDRVGLPTSDEFLRRYPHQLSGGQLQRVTLAMAFAPRPSLIVFDEPTTGLDVTTQRRVLDTIYDLCQDHAVSGVYVSHDLAVVSSVAQEVAVMYAGRIVESGPTAEIFERPSHPYTRGLLAAIPEIGRATRLRGIDGVPPRPGRRAQGCAFAPRCDRRTAECEVAPPEQVQHGTRTIRCIHPIDQSTSAEATLIAQPRLQRTEHRSAEALVTVGGLSARYGEREVVHGVNLTIPSRSCVALVGESGSGKTTLGRCIAGLHANYDGTVQLGKRKLAAAVRDRSRADLRRIQYIFQNPYTSMNPRITVGEIIEQPLRELLKTGRQQREQDVEHALDEVSLSRHFIGRMPGELSGGERQRVAIARALILAPDLMVCDEVTSALDVSVQAQIIELFQRLQRERALTLLFITHDLPLVHTIADEVVVLSDGVIVEAGAARQVFEAPRDAYTRRLISDVPKMRDQTTRGAKLEPSAQPS